MVQGMRLPLCMLVLASCTGCLVGPVRIVDHSYATSASRLTSSVAVALETTSKGRRVDLTAGDDIASFTFRVRPGKILATIRNEGAEPLWLVLEEARHVDPEGEWHELYVAAPDRRGAPQHRVEAASEVTIFLWPRDWLREESQYGPGIYRGDSPLSGESTVGKARERKRDLGRGFEILLPVEVGATRYLYRFRFTVRKVHVKVILWA